MVGPWRMRDEEEVMISWTEVMWSYLSGVFVLLICLSSSLFGEMIQLDYYFFEMG